MKHGFLTERPFAHRGLHGSSLVENSLSAFAAAIDGGFGMECDVQASADGVAFVFHDATLDRLTGRKGPVGAWRAEDLDRVMLSGTDEPIPRLTALLSLVAGRTPLLIEVKAPQVQVAPLCEAVAEAVLHYAGPVAVMSFNPEVGAWFARNASGVARGLVVTEEGKRGLGGRIERNLAFWRARPDFLAYDIRDLPRSAFAARAHKRGLPMLTWTVRTQAQWAAAAHHADQPIFEQIGHADQPIFEQIGHADQPIFEQMNA